MFKQEGGQIEQQVLVLLPDNRYLVLDCKSLNQVIIFNLGITSGNQRRKNCLKIRRAFCSLLEVTVQVLIIMMSANLSVFAVCIPFSLKLKARASVST
jgi:hypothetical protein